MHKEHISRSLLIFVSAILFFLIAELVLKFFWQMSPSVKRSYYQRSNNPFIRYELIPNTKTGEININSAGFRGPEIKVRKGKNTYRILMLGDSELFSCLLPENDTLSRQLENILNNNSRNFKYEVINTGVEGYNTYQELEVLKTRGLEYSPDLVILNYVLNDPEPGEYYFGNNFFSRNSALYRYIIYRVKKGMIKRERKKLGIDNELAHFNYLHSGESFQHLKNAIIEMAGLLESRGIKFIINMFPTSSIEVVDFKDNYPYGHIHKLIKSIKHENIIFIDPIEEFNRLGMTPQTVSINYQYNESHKNSNALGVMANFLYKAIEENKLIP